jgi:branched-chain amino acid transport system ATP-binding protein
MAARPCSDDVSGWSYGRVLSTFPRLAERLHHLGAHLSGGEQQMLALGRALLTQPRLIILDEATEGLAPKIVLEIWRVVEEIRASGIAALIVDRNHRKVLEESDSAVVMLKGRVVLAEASSVLRGRDELASHLGV